MHRLFAVLECEAHVKFTLYFAGDQALKRRRQEPSSMALRDRHGLCLSGQSTPVDKPRVPEKLLEIENNLNNFRNT